MALDPWTCDSIRNMVRYIADDARIARHVGCAIDDVRRLRRQLRPTQSEMIARRMPAGPSVGIADEPWIRSARRGSDRLVVALERARSPISDSER